ncbi:MAG: PqqD family peptide modification chaperone, partial [Acidimicrobiales bacterium]
TPMPVPEPAGTTLAVGATAVRIQIDDVAVRDAFDVAFSSLASEGEPEHEATITPTDHGFALRIDGEDAYSGSDASNVVDVFVSWCNREAIESRIDAVNLHAAGVVAPGTDRAVVIPAAPGSGKTTTAAIACGQGWGYLSDEMVSVESDGTLAGYAKPLTFKTGTKDLIDSVDYGRWDLSSRQNRWYLPASYLGGYVVDTAVAHALVFVSYEPDKPTDASELGPAEAALELVTNCQDLLDDQGNALTVLATLASNTHAYRLDQSNTDAVMEVLDNVADAPPVKPSPVTPLTRSTPGSDVVGPCINEDVVGAVVADGVIIHRPSTRGIALLDPLAGAIWQLLDGSTTEAGLVQELAEAFDHPREEIEADVFALLDQLRTNEFLSDAGVAD